MTSQLRPYKAIVWVEDAPGVRIEVMALSGEDALQKIREEYGETAVASLWSEDDANRLRVSNKNS